MQDLYHQQYPPKKVPKAPEVSVASLGVLQKALASVVATSPGREQFGRSVDLAS